MFARQEGQILRLSWVPLVVLAFIFCAEGTSESVRFQDKNLKRLVENALGISEPNTGDMLGLTALAVKREAIVSLEGLQHARNLKTILLYRTKIAEISPLAELTNLEAILLNNNLISDITPLRKLTALTHVWLSCNQISDVSGLAHLQNLCNLSLERNSIREIDSLANLRQLQTLLLSENAISSISPLARLDNLRVLNLDSNTIEDVSPLAGLTSLEYLSLKDNKISDISPLSALTNLKKLNLEHNNIKDISPLLPLRCLTDLNLNLNPLNRQAHTVHLPVILGENPDIRLACHQLAEQKEYSFWQNPNIRMYISWRPKVSSDGDKMAILAGPEYLEVSYLTALDYDEVLASFDSPSPNWSNLYVLDVSSESCNAGLVPGSRGTLNNGVNSFDWFERNGQQYLVMATNPKYGDATVSMFSVSDGPELSLVFSCSVNNYPNVLGSLACNPDGRILAGDAARDPTLYITDHLWGPPFNLALFSLENKQCTATDLQLSVGRRIWLNSHTLYGRRGDNVVEIKIHDGQAEVARNIPLPDPEACYWFGIADGELLYSAEEAVYRGSQVLHSYRDSTGQLLTDGDLLAVRDANDVYVLDLEGVVRNSRQIPEDTRLFALSAESGFVYLLKNRQVIQRYDFATAGEICTIFDVSSLK